MNFRSLHDRVLVHRVTTEEKTDGGIIIPDIAKEKPQACLWPRPGSLADAGVQANARSAPGGLCRWCPSCVMEDRAVAGPGCEDLPLTRHAGQGWSVAGSYLPDGGTMP